ncbi:uncharacterized protein LOC135395156 [Ornithodoros turicata]|uniref:uncharacterized protein LOC135395156 n=1 Tax=Ornithodoros turicata TaxID=34597 RepID=UPI003139CCE6
MASTSCTSDWAELPKKKKMKLQTTKKKGCTAYMHIKKIQAYPEYTVSTTLSTRGRKDAKGKALAKLRDAIRESDSSLLVEQRIYISISAKDGHTNHKFGEAIYYAQPVNSKVTEEIERLVHKGITSVKEVQQCLVYFVDDIMFAGKEKPEDACRAFYPTKEDIGNRIRSVLRKDRFSEVDQDNAAALIMTLQEQESTSHFFFRPYRSSEHIEQNSPDLSCASGSDDILSLVSKECTEKLLFCYQSAFMKSLMQKYADTVVCLDATHKTTDYALPLFLLAVETPVGYMNVGIFITQFETAECISEALRIFKQWCPSFSPMFWMVDYSIAEINAISAIFPDSEIAICDVHRERAWDRWLRRKENGVKNQEEALTLLRKIARATTEEEYKHAKEALWSSEVWSSNSKLQHYLNEVWFSVEKMWVKLFRLQLPIATNNGVESQNKLLKEHYIKQHSGRKSLAGLIGTLVGQFLPERKRIFLERNMKLSTEYRLCRPDLPSYLHNRPPKVVKHIMTRITAAGDFMREDILGDNDDGQGIFKVRSLSQDGLHHTVNFNAPSCTCKDFITTQLPCKHFCAIFLLFDSWGFDHLPEKYRNSPALTLDRNVDTRSDMEVDILHHDDITCAPTTSENSAPLQDLQKVQRREERRVRNSVIHALEHCKSSVYYCHDISKMKNVLNRLAECQAELQDGMSTSNGLTVWKTNMVVPLLKPSQSPRNIDSFRPIALTSCVGKTLERMVFRRLSWYLKTARFFPEAVQGFEQGRSLIDNVNDLVTETQQAKADWRAEDHMTDVVFLDVKRAYDSVFHSAIIATLQETGVGGALLLWIQDFLRDH